MAKKKIEDKTGTEKPRVHKDLNGFDIQINSFGEIQMSYDIEKINQFLNKTVDDKKLRNRK
jgi:NADH/NAD ratio-sensing transcriptional regulator Rex